MITRKMIARGLIDGVIRLIMSPHEDGVVASVGEYWFYFGGQTAEECSSVEEYTAAVPFDDIVTEIYDVLDEFKDFPEFETEYRYYEAYLNESIAKTEADRKAKFMEYVEKNFFVDSAFKRLVSNVIDFAFAQGSDEEERNVLLALLENTCGLTEEEILTLTNFEED